MNMRLQRSYTADFSLIDDKSLTKATKQNCLLALFKCHCFYKRDSIASSVREKETPARSGGKYYSLAECSNQFIMKNDLSLLKDLELLPVLQKNK